jgi:diacylglycerol O-acyltransferase
MSARHLDRLTIADAAFLRQEDRGPHAHIGWVLIASGPPPAYADLLKHVKSRLHLVPRYRQKVAFSPLRVSPPFWIDDPGFNIEYHVRHTALPAPGSLDQLRATVGRIFSQGLDRSKPLWELWLLQGLHDDRFAIVNKTHRALIDGGAGVDLTTVLFDTSQHPAPLPPPERPWLPHPEPSPAELVAAGIRDLVSAPFEVARRAVGALDDPDAAIASAREVVKGLQEVAAAYLSPSSATPLNVRIGTHRQLYWTRCPLNDFKRIKDTFGGTINDVYLTVVTGALAYWLARQGIRRRGLQLRAAVPISLRSRAGGLGAARQTGARVVECFAPLPVGVSDPVERLRIVRRALDDLKHSKQALGARAIAALQDFTPPALLAQASRLSFSRRMFNLVAANIPGPQLPLYLLGHEVVQIGPVGFLEERCALMVTLVSYNGMLEFGLIADADAVPDLDALGGGIDDAVADLLEAARKHKPKGRGRKGRGGGANT